MAGEPGQGSVGQGRQQPGSIGHTIPVHMVYFTAVVDETGKVSTFADLYGLDSKVAAAVLGKSEAFAATSDDATADSPQAETETAPAPKRKAPKDEVAGSMQGMFGD